MKRLVPSLPKVMMVMTAMNIKKSYFVVLVLLQFVYPFLVLQDYFLSSSLVFFLISFDFNYLCFVCLHFLIL